MSCRKILLIFLIFLFPASVYAAFSFSISATQPETVSDPVQEIPVSFTLSGLPSPSYFRVAFQKSSGSTYFGQIKNDSGDWVDITSLSGDCHNYYYVSDTSATSLTIFLRVGSNTTPDSGQYLIRAHRFTQTACSATEAQNSLTADFIFATPTPNPSPTPIPPTAEPPTSTPRSPTVKPPTNTPKPSVIPTIKPTPLPPRFTSTPANLPSILPTSIFTPSFTPDPSTAGQLLADDVSSSVPASINLVVDSPPDELRSASPLGAALIISGGIFFIVSAFLLIKKSGKISF
jgi:hypothetical protein